MYNIQNFHLYYYSKINYKIIFFDEKLLFIYLAFKYLKNYFKYI